MLVGWTETQYVFFGLIVTALVAPTWLGFWNARIAKKQVTPDSGLSLKDQVTRIETKVDIQSLIQKKHDMEMQEFNVALSAMSDKMATLQQAQEQRREIITEEQGETP